MRAHEAEDRRWVRCSLRFLQHVEDLAVPVLLGRNDEGRQRPHRQRQLRHQGIVAAGEFKQPCRPNQRAMEVDVRLPALVAVTVLASDPHAIQGFSDALRIDVGSDQMPHRHGLVPPPDELKLAEVSF